MENNIPEDDSKLDDLRNSDEVEDPNGPENQLLSYEHLIDPGNEHHHLFDEKKIEGDVARTSKEETDPANNISGNKEQKLPGAKNEDPDKM
jgi:hypothetical protein